MITYVNGSPYKPKFDFYKGYVCVLRIIERYQMVKDSKDVNELQSSIDRMYVELVDMVNSFSLMMHEVQPHLKEVQATRVPSFTHSGKKNGYSVHYITNSRNNPLPHPVPKTDSKVESP